MDDSETASGATGEGLARPATATTTAEDWSPPREEPGTGIALNGDYPLNLRLRAERLFDDGKTEDPDGIITPEAISGTGERLARERAAEEAEARLTGKTKPELEFIAAVESVDLSLASNNADRVRLIEEARG